MLYRTFVLLLGLVVWSCIMDATIFAQSPNWKAAKLKSDSVSFGQIASSGSGITVEGKFTDKSRIYQVLAEQGQFVQISDGTRTGWVFRVNLEAVTDVAPDDPDLDNKPTTSRDPLIGQNVFFKDSAVAMIGSQVVDKYKVVDWPNRVGDVQGDWVWLGRAWIRRSELMLLPEAFDYYVEEVRRNPQSASAWLRRGVCWDEKGEYDSAIKDYDESLRLDPKIAPTWSNRGLAKHSKQDYDGAIRDYDEAIRLDPKLARAWNNRGWAKYFKQDYDGAIWDYDEAIRLDPKFVLAWGNRGNAKGDKRDYEGAIRDYDEAIRLDPKYVYAWCNRGLAKYYKQDYDGAIRDYDEAIRLDPKHAWAWYSLGLSRMLTRQPAATQDFAQVLEIQGWQGDLSSYAVIFGSLAARLLGDEPRAQKFLADADGKLKQEWPFPVIAYLQGQRSAGDLLALASDNDKQTEAHCYIGLNLLASGNTTAARKHLEWVRDNGNKSYVEYPVALAELSRLKPAPKEQDKSPDSSSDSSANQPALETKREQGYATTKAIRRVLTDVSGNRQVTVDVLRLDGNTVQVRTLEGKTTSVSLGTLSEPDREWLKRNFEK